MLSRLSARWKTSPLKKESLYNDAGVLGTVACAAGPKAADNGVAGRGEVVEMGVALPVLEGVGRLGVGREFRERGCNLPWNA